MARVQVLLADDEPFILKGLQMLIDWELYGCEIAGTASNGLEAYNIIKSKKIDLAIVDIRMPELTGLELISTERSLGIFHCSLSINLTKLHKKMKPY